MKKFLERVGVPTEVLELIPEICQTCKVCREWQKPGPSNASNIDIPDKFNDQVECDLLFVSKHIIFHLLDRCIRWHSTGTIPTKGEEDCMKAISSLWINIFAFHAR